MPSLIQQKCEPCEGGIPPLTHAEYTPMLEQTPGWTVSDEKSLTRTFTFKNFVAAMKFLNQVAEIAEQEGHHPDFTLHEWNQVSFKLSTHAIGGLSKNDFILAAKINRLLDKSRLTE